MESSRQDVLIVGAGLTGLNLARQIRLSHQDLKMSLVEKSKSCGGRMATRRVGDSKFDHGAQFIKITKASQDLLNVWSLEGVLQNFPSPDFEARCGISGMTQLTKVFSKNLDIAYASKVISIKKLTDGWEIFLESGESVFSTHVVLTCPLPQALDILDSSGIPYDPLLKKITYRKGIVLLVQFDKEINFSSYVENVDQNIFSITSQQAKGLSTEPSYTIAMQSHWSEDCFEKPEQEIYENSKILLQTKFPLNNVSFFQIKKWKFCQPNQIWHRFFENPSPGLYLAGDAFGGASLNGAIKSSQALAEHVKNSIV